MPDQVEAIVVAARRRLIQQAAADRVVGLLRWALAGSVVLLGADRVWRLRFEPWYLIAVVIGLAVAGGLLLAWHGRPSRLRAAALLDAELRLDERLSSAVALRAGGLTGPVAEAVMADAERAAVELTLAEALPRRWPLETRLCLVLAVTLGALGFVPQLGWWRSESDLAAQFISRQLGDELAATARRVEREAEQQDLLLAREQARRLWREALALRQARLGKEQALRQLDAVGRSLQSARDELAGRPLTKTARDALDELARADGLAGELGQRLSADLAAARDLLREIEAGLRSGELSGEDLQRAAEALRQAAEALADSPYHETGEALRSAAEATSRTAAEPDSQAACQAAGEAVGQAAETLVASERELTEHELIEQLQAAAEGGKGAVGDCETLRREAAGGACASGLCERYGAARAGRGRGPGTTNFGAAPTPAEGAAQSAESGDPPTDPVAADYDQLYAPRRVETVQRALTAAGEFGAEGSLRASQGGRQAPRLSDARTPYYEVLGEYEAAAADAISRGEIPITERHRVQRYFEALRQSEEE